MTVSQGVPTGSEPHFRLTLLGHVNLQAQDGSPVEAVVSQPKRLAVLAYLAMAPGTAGRRRDEVVARFWPDRRDTEARKALRQTVYFLRKHLGPGALVTRADRIVLHPGLWTCDVVQLEMATQAGNQDRVAELYTGDFMPGFHFSDGREWEAWLDGERLRLRTLVLDALWSLGSKAASAQSWNLSKARFDQILRIDPHNEEALVERTVATVRLGRGFEAHAFVDDFRGRLRADMERDILPPTEQALAPLLAGARQQPGEAEEVTSKTPGRTPPRRLWPRALLGLTPVAILLAWLQLAGPPAHQPFVDPQGIEASTTDSMAFRFWTEALPLQSKAQLDLSTNQYMVAVLDAAIERDPGFAEAIALKGMALTTRYQTLGMDRENARHGLSLLEHAVDLNSDSYWVRFFQAHTLFWLGRLQDAHVAALAAAKARPGSRGATVFLDGVAYERGDIPESLEWAALSLQAWPEDETTMLYLGIKFLTLGDLARAEYWLNLAQSTRPRAFLGILSMVDLARGDYDRAQLRTDSATLSTPDFPAVWRRAADVALARRDWATALAHSQRLIDFGNTGVSVVALSPRAKRGLALVRLGEIGAGRADLLWARDRAVEAIDRGDERWNHRLEIAAVDALLGNPEAALDWLDRAHEAGARTIPPFVRPAFDAIQTHGRYRRLVDRMSQERAAALHRIIRDGLEPPTPQDNR